MHRLLRLRYAAHAGSGLVFLAGLGFLLFVLSVDIGVRTQVEVEKFVSRIHETSRHRLEFLDSLRAMSFEGCDETALARLRGGLFEFDLINDAVIFAPGTNDILCTALTGRLSEPITLSGQKKMAGAEPGIFFWMGLTQVPEWGRSKNFLFRSGEVGVFFFDQAEKQLGDGFEYAGFQVLPSGARKLISGRPEVLANYLSLGWNPLERALYAVECLKPKNRACFLIYRHAYVVARDEVIIGCGGLLANLALTFSAFGYLRRHASREMQVSHRIRRAIRAGGAGILCHYQPIVAARTGRVVGCEVLARFDDGLGPVSPAEFIPEVQALGLTWEFTEIILLRAIEELRPLTDVRPRFRISVNVFPVDLTDECAHRLQRSLALRIAGETGLCLCLEVLESGVQSWDRMTKFRDFATTQGFEIAIDDFGTGFSNIAQVRRAAVDILKIDRSFIREIGRDEKALRSSLIRPVLDIARSVRARVVAEGIETAEQRAILEELGVDCLQGFYFARPMPIRGFLDHVWMSERMDGGEVIRLQLT